MSDDQWQGTTRDPIALLEQLLGHVAGVKRELTALREDMDAVKQDVAQLKQDVSQLKQDVSQLKQDVSQLKQDVSQLKQDVSQLQWDMAELKGELAAFKQEVAERFDRMDERFSDLKTEVRSLRSDMTRFVKGLDEEQKAHLVHVESTLDRRDFLLRERLREEADRRQADLERRIAALEEAERNRRQREGG